MLMALAGHGAVCTSAATRGLAGLFVPDHAPDGQNDRQQHRCQDQDVRNVICQPADHLTASFLAGLNKRKHKPANTRTAAIRPMTLTLPEKREPIWKTISETAYANAH